MALEMLIGVNVTDEAGYQAYRDNMTPLLEAHQGGFGYDFKVSEVLKSATKEPINRVFTIYFPDEATKDSFFANEDYVQIKHDHFENSVSHVTRIATYEK